MNNEQWTMRTENLFQWAMDNCSASREQKTSLLGLCRGEACNHGEAVILVQAETNEACFDWRAAAEDHGESRNFGARRTQKTSPGLDYAEPQPKITAEP